MIRTLRALVTISVVIFLAQPSSGLALDFTGRVVGVSDGDTITVLHGQERLKLRLSDVDAPELHGQAFGHAAKKFTSSIVFGKDVLVHAEKMDRYRRWIAVVVLPNGLVLNQALVQAGYAWWYRQYSTNKIYAALEADAKAARRGLWQDPHPIAPWTFRRQKSATP